MAKPGEGSGERVVGAPKGISLDNSDLGEEKQIVGRKIWRIFPYVMRYWKLALGGLIANAGARASDLLPFLTIGWAADFYANGTFNPSWL